jgi:hypothetical protein
MASWLIRMVMSSGKSTGRPRAICSGLHARAHRRYCRGPCRCPFQYTGWPGTETPLGTFDQARSATHALWAYQPIRSIRTHAIPAQIPKVIASMREAGKNVMASFLPARMSETDDREALFRGRHCLFCRGAFRAARSSQPFDRRRDNEIEPIWFPQRHVSIAYVLALNAEITRRARAKKVSPAGGTAGLWGLGSNYREGDRRLPSQNYNGAEVRRGHRAATVLTRQRSPHPHGFGSRVRRRSRSLYGQRAARRANACTSTGAGGPLRLNESGVSSPSFTLGAEFFGVSIG